MSKRLVLILFIGLMGISYPKLSAQSISDVSTLKVDQLSDSQIRQLLRKAQDAGVSEQQLYSLAQQRGMSAVEVNKLRRRVSQLGGSSGSLSQSQASDGESNQLREPLDEGGLDLFETLASEDSLKNDGLTDLEQKIFGYSIFHEKNPNFSPNFNMATPQNYVVGPSDQLVIEIYGVAQDNFSLTVSPEGKISIPTIGMVHVSGFTIETVTGLLKAKLTQRFSGLKGPNPNTFLSVTVGNFRTIKVNIVGELKSPGTYALPSIVSVFNALYAAGGPTTKGTFRNIQVYRSGKLISEVDIYNFLTKGDDTSNVRLEDNDVILVRPIELRVELSGEVRTPGFFEVKNGETLSDVLNFGGGFTEKAYRQLISVRRNTPVQKKIETILSDQYSVFEPQDGDEYIIGEIIDRFTNRVQISGAITRPGEYELTNEITLKKLIEQAGGLQGDAFLSRVTLYRNSDNFTLQAKSLDLKAILDGTDEDVQLQNEDIIHIPSRYDVREEYYVEISGEVNRTGIFPYSENLTVGDLVLSAGGFKEAASGSSIEIARRARNAKSGKMADIYTINVEKDLSLSSDDQGFNLEPFDHVFIRKSPGYKEQKLITIEGEVNFPGEYALENVSMRISDLIKRAGGVNEFAYPKGATLVRRTEFFEQPASDGRTVKSLQDLKRNTQRDQIDNSAAEKLLLERLDKKLEDREEEIAKKELEEFLDPEATQFRLERLADLAGTEKSEIKDTELVGINLDLILEKPGSKYDLILQEGDVISIPRELQTVRLRGQVLYPTTTRFDQHRGFKNYISSAGGFSAQANKKRSYVIYANGDVKRTRSFLWVRNYPEIEPGAEIIVPQAPARVGISGSIQQVAGLTTTILTTYLLLRTSGIIQ